MSIRAVLAALQLQMPHNAKSVLIHLAVRTIDDATTYPSQGDTMTGTCLSERSVRRAVGQLLKLGHITETGTTKNRTPVYNLAYLTRDTGHTDRYPQVEKPANRAEIPATADEMPANRAEIPATVAPRRKEQTGREEGRQEISPHLLLRIESPKEKKPMSALREHGCKIDHDVAALQDALRAEWRNACRGLTEDEIGAVLATATGPCVHPSHFRPLRTAWEAATGWKATSAPSIITPEAADARHRAKVANGLRIWRGWEKKETDRHGAAYWNRQRSSLSANLDQDIRAEVLALAAAEDAAGRGYQATKQAAASAPAREADTATLGRALVRLTQLEDRPELAAKVECVTPGLVAQLQDAVKKKSPGLGLVLARLVQALTMEQGEDEGMAV